MLTAHRLPNFRQPAHRERGRENHGWFWNRHCLLTALTRGLSKPAKSCYFPSIHPSVYLVSFSAWVSDSVQAITGLWGRLFKQPVNGNRSICMPMALYPPAGNQSNRNALHSTIQAHIHSVTQCQPTATSPVAVNELGAEVRWCKTLVKMISRKCNMKIQ